MFAAGVLLGSLIPDTPDGRPPVVEVLRAFGVASSHGRADATPAHGDRSPAVHGHGPDALVAETGGGHGASPAVPSHAVVEPRLVGEQADTGTVTALAPVSRSAAAPVTGKATPRSGASARRRPVPRSSPLERQVLDVMDQYEAAYSRMDVARLQALWPASDRQALARTFGETSEHRLTLSRCAVAVLEGSATTRCLGVLRSRPRRSEERTRVERGEWTFQLERESDRWAIASVVSR